MNKRLFTSLVIRVNKFTEYKVFVTIIYYIHIIIEKSDLTYCRRHYGKNNLFDYLIIKLDIQPVYKHKQVSRALNRHLVYLLLDLTCLFLFKFIIKTSCKNSLKIDFVPLLLVVACYYFTMIKCLWHQQQRNITFPGWVVLMK